MAKQRDPAKKTRADHVYDLLLAQFVEGTREAGQPLNIPAIAREFDLSQTPVREALARLEHTGLVRRTALKGYSVAPLPTEQELQKLMDARLVIEPAITREAARRVTPEFLDTLEATVVTLEGAGEHADFTISDYRLADEAFHGLIAAQSANPFLESAYQALGGQVQRFRLFSPLGSTDIASAAAEHRGILEAMVARDVEGAVERMHAHIEGARSRSLSDRTRLG